MIEAPEEFRRACRNLEDSAEEMAESLDGLAQVALIGIDRNDAAVIRDFITKILATIKADGDLKEFWWTMPATLVFHDGRDVRLFLNAVQLALSRAPYNF